MPRLVVCTVSHEDLHQTSWTALRAEFPHLKPAQLHHMLREYNTGRACPSCWKPSSDDAEAAHQTSEILESFDNHPPLILPNNTFKLEIQKPITEPGYSSHLQCLQEFINTHKNSQTHKSLQDNNRDQMETVQSVLSRFSSESECLIAPSITVQLSPEEERHWLSSTPPQGRGSHADLSSCEALLAQKLKNLELQNNLPEETDLRLCKSLALDPSCLLTPPNTPQSVELSELEVRLQEEAAQYNRENGLKRNADQMTERKEEDDQEVFTVEVSKGPHGLGLALVDGLKSPLGMSGIYIKSVVPGSPAAQCQTLKMGDRILAVNGVSLVGMDYLTGREIIRGSGDSLRLLVAKSEIWSNSESTITRC